MNIEQRLAQEFSMEPAHVKNIIEMTDQGDTIPFIARYRKERTGSCDDQVLRGLVQRLEYLRELDKRRQFVLEAVTGQGKADKAWLDQLEQAQTLAQIEDLYQPFKPKRRTRGAIAREKGLEPLALALMAQPARGPAPETLARAYIQPQAGVSTAQEALALAADIAAEQIADRADLRGRLRESLMTKGRLISRKKTQEPSVYDQYADFSMAIPRLSGYQVLAMNRGEKEGVLAVSMELGPLAVMAALERLVLRGHGPYEAWMRAAAEDAYKRLLLPSLEREARAALTDGAQEQAMALFAANLQPLLMQPPLKGKAVLGFDPGYRTGCKVAVVDATGKLMATDTVYPTPPHNQTRQAAQRLKELIKDFDVEVIAVGNGTASHESEVFIADLIRELARPVAYMVVSEAGASVYSASPQGAEEFPSLDVSVRSAVSIARRLQDPLAELVKIDPKALGVGQYQHDMPPKRLQRVLEAVVEDCVNAVGVDVNRASAALLGYVSGLNKTTASNIVTYREENGSFTGRAQIKKVPRLGEKAFEQCAGFLRVPESKNLLDHTAVHPERYGQVKVLLKKLGLAPKQLKTAGDTARAYGLERLAEECQLGLPTLKDILEELSRPGRDPRDSLPAPMLRTDVMGMEDLQPSMTMKGTVRNVTDFGAFVDVGVHQDGLVHRSRMGTGRNLHPAQRVRVGDIVTVRVLEVDMERKRISLEMPGDMA